MISMERMVAFCGIVCTECPGFLATINDDDDERKRVAELWSREFNADIKPEDINCDGCLSEGGRLISHCSVCKIRKCGQEKGFENCAYCDEYVCDELDKFFKMVPDARTTLDKIRKNL